MKVCPKCGGRRFYAHQIYHRRLDVIVDGDNIFKEFFRDSTDEVVYKQETPYGPYCCVECGEEFQSLDSLKEQE